MSTQTPISPLKKVQFMQTSNPTVCGLQLTDFKDKQITAGVDAGGLAFVTAALLEQARHPAFAAASAEANEQPALCSVAGDALTFAPGRSADELAVMLTIGSVEVAVHLPRTEVERAIAALRAAD
jgi:hypothetical protein